MIAFLRLYADMSFCVVFMISHGLRCFLHSFALRKLVCGGRNGVNGCHISQPCLRVTEIWEKIRGKTGVKIRLVGDHLVSKASSGVESAQCGLIAQSN